MHVLFLGPLPQPVTGQSLACQVLLEALRQQHEVDVVNFSKREFKQGISSVSRVLAILGLLYQAWKKRNSGDVIYLTTSESVAGNLKDLVLYTTFFRRLKTMAIHLHGGGGMREILSPKSRVLRRMNSFFLRRLGAIIVLGQRQVGIFSDTVAKQKIHIVENFAEDYLFTTESAIERKFEQAVPLRVLFLSNLLPGKGYQELAEALLAMDERVRAALLIDFAGGFESEAQRRDFLARVSGYPQIRYHGIVHGEQKRQLLSQAHVFCLPTYYRHEGQPISILEAYASGCAVITTDHSGILDVFADGVNGYVVAKQSAVAVKAALERAIAETNILCGMAKTNLHLAQRKFRTSRHTRDIVTILRDLSTGPA